MERATASGSGGGIERITGLAGSVSPLETAVLYAALFFVGVIGALWLSARR